MAKIRGNRNGVGAARSWEALGGLGGPGNGQPPGVLQEVPRKKYLGLGSLPLHLRGRASSGP